MNMLNILKESMNKSINEICENTNSGMKSWKPLKAWK